MKIINNTTEKLADDLRVTIKKRSRVSMAAACFSVYAFEELKAQLENLDELRFIFTSPAFLDEKPKKAQREFYIPRLNRERTLHGSEFEIKLRSEFRQRAISQECAHWIREKARFKSNKTMEGMTGFLTVDSDSPVAYAPVNGFTREDLGCDRGGRMFSMINRVDAPESKAYLELFDQLWNDQSHLKDVTDKVLESITTAYQENSPEFLYFYALYNIFGSFLEQVNEDDLPSEANGFKESQVWNKLYTFQKDAVIAIISKLEQYNGCILADSVGLGKTFTALAVIKYYENRNLRVLVLCPKKLSDNWMTYKANYVNNPIAGDRLRYDVLYHTDLSRDKGFSGEIDLSKLNWSAYDLVVIDESHNFRNGGDVDNEGKENRYTRLMNKVIRPGARTRVLMLSATPVNNRFYDLRNQLALAYEGDSSEWQGKLDISRSVEEVFRNAQKVFNEWSKLDVASRTTDQLMQIHEYVVLYAKSNGNLLNKISAHINERDYKNPDNDPRGPYKTMPCTNKGGAIYSVMTPSGKTITEEWRFKRETYDRLLNDNRLVFPRDGDGKPRYKLFLSEKKSEGQLANTWLDFLASNQEATREIKSLFGNSTIFSTPKPVELIKFCMDLATKTDSIVLDFFSGSATTAHAVMQLNAEDGGHRKFIMVQLPEPCDENSEAFKAGYKNICEIGKERIRRAGEKIKEENPLTTQNLDIGFRVFRVDESNMKNVYYHPEEVTQLMLGETVSNIKEDRTDLDLLYACLLDWGVEINLSHTSTQVAGCTVHNVDNGALAACFDKAVPRAVVEYIANLQPLRAVFRDSAFATDAEKINVTEICIIWTALTCTRPTRGIFLSTKRRAKKPALWKERSTAKRSCPMMWMPTT